MVTAYISSNDGRKSKITGAGTGTGHNKKKGKGRGNNPRLTSKRDEIKDPDLLRELKDGAVQLSYSSSDPL